MNMNRSVDIMFICPSLAFNISVSTFYIAAKRGEMVIMRVCGGIVISLMVPFTTPLLGYMREKAPKRDDTISRLYSRLPLAGIVAGLYP